MARIEDRIFVSAPAERIFRYITDPENAPEYNRNFVNGHRLSEGPTRLGSKARLEVRVGPMSYHVVTRVVEYEEGRLFTSSSVSPIGFSQSTALEPQEDGTWVRFALGCDDLPGLSGVLLRRLLVNKNEVRKTLLFLKEIMESQRITAANDIG
jgi:hypothetical protein